MSLKSYFPNIHLNSPLTTPPNLTILHIKNFHIRQLRIWRRRRLKTNRCLVVRNQLGPLPFENLFEDLVSQFPSVNSLDLIAPVLGFASGVALHLSRLKTGRNSETSNIGEWILFTSPTTFNRFVILRCPSISMEGSELLEDVNEKLVEEDRHFVRLNSGRIQVRDSDGRENLLEEKVMYQRVCVSTDDGGVISLDWPANLDLTDEHGLDSTLLLVPGTAEGSMDWNIQSFVLDCLKRGLFPVVMNPRGCAGSPLTTPRLFTAADSDDICTAIQFLKGARPWTTFMGVGWGYGANMLTKYLAEVGEKTPLVAATCIDNPFDLEEATRSSPHHIAVDQKLRSGLIEILRSNKELFHGRAKGFDVEKALLAKSVQDFEKEISMVSFGYDTLEDFYAKSSTRGVVESVKIPVLFIQTDDGTVPLFSIPRSLIAENPFTSLLLCSRLPSRAVASGKSTLLWCQELTIEWLTAVELGLLKGRHPLLKDIDVAINPLKGLALVEGRASKKSATLHKFLKLAKSDASSGYSINPLKEMPEGSDIATTILSSSMQDLQTNFKPEIKGFRQEINIQQTSSVDAGVVKEDGVDDADGVDSERGHMLQTTQVVMNMLDLTMPGTLSEEQKKKVLTAVDQGETLVKALQDAVPEDVREKLTSAVSGILHNQGTNLKFDALSRIPNVASGLSSKIQEKVGGLSSKEGGNEDHDSYGQRNRVNDLANGSQYQPTTEKPAAGLGLEPQASENLQKSNDSNDVQSTGSLRSDSPDSLKKGNNDLENHNENAVLSLEKDAQSSEYVENGSAKADFSRRFEMAGGSEDVINEQHKVDQDGGMAQLDMKEDKTVQKDEGKITDSSSEQNKIMSSTKTEELPSPENQLMEREGNDNLKKEDKSMQPVVNQNSSDPPNFSVSQALDALTGMDDSTQVAVNSVFGVIENMITQMEEKDNEIEVKDGNEVRDQKAGSPSENHHTADDKGLEEEENEDNLSAIMSDILDDPPPSNNVDLQNHARTKWVEEECISFGRNSVNSFVSDTVNRIGKEENRKRDHLGGQKLLSKNTSSFRYLNDVQLYITNPYGDLSYKGYLQNYHISSMENTKPLDLDKTTALFLDYFPEEGQWKLLEQPGNTKDSIGDVESHEVVEREIQASSNSKENCTDEVIEPSYVILDAEDKQEPLEESEMVDKMNQKFEVDTDASVELLHLVKNIILDSLGVEVGRRLSSADIREMEANLAIDLEQVANAVSHAVGQGEEHILFLERRDHTSEKFGALSGDQIVKAISLAVQETSYLKRVLPIGIIVGSCLATLRKFFDVATVSVNIPSESLILNSRERNHVQVGKTDINHNPSEKTVQSNGLDNPIKRIRERAKPKGLHNDHVMVGAVTAALGASALLVHRQNSYKGSGIAGTLSNSVEKENRPEADKLEEELSEKSQNNIVTSLAEKAMSVAGPVVPTKEDGEVDQERLVSMLAELGQKGGMLRLVGKIALLWGGIRGAVSLTDRLMSFLHIAERPLIQRILGFVCMVLVLWSPVVVPLLPTLVQNWATHNSNKIVEFVSIIGLCASIMILIVLWGKRIRGYEDPLEKYGLDLISLPKIQNLLKGFVGGVTLVLSLHSVNALLGCVHLSWPSTLPLSSLDAMTRLKVYGRMLLLIGQGLATAIGVALVEEILFRSWLPDEIATDLGYHRGIIISGFAFSLVQRSPWAIPGLWLLSLGLSGARQRSQGSLSVPIGLRAGILASSFILEKGGFLTYEPNFPLWVTRTLPFQPFSGVAGIAFALLLALVLYPREPLHQNEKTRIIRE